MASFPSGVHPSQAHPDPKTPAAVVPNSAFISSIDPNASSIAFANCFDLEIVTAEFSADDRVRRGRKSSTGTNRRGTGERKRETKNGEGRGVGTGENEECRRKGREGGEAGRDDERAIQG